MSFLQEDKTNKTLVQNDEPSMVQIMQNMMSMMKIIIDRLDKLKTRNPDTIQSTENHPMDQEDLRIVTWNANGIQNRKQETEVFLI